jgi:hypothetical protein
MISGGFVSAVASFNLCLQALLMIDLGLLLLRAAGFLLAFTFGIQKIGWYVTAFHAGKPLSSIGLTPLIVHVGFPLPVILAIVDHVERIDRRALSRDRFSDTVRSGESRLGNGWCSLYQCALG